MGSKFCHITLILCLALGLMAEAVWADGDETLGPPSVTIADGNGIVAAGTGLNTQPGTIDVTVPAGATVLQVLLYWEGGLPIDPTFTTDTITVNSLSVTGQEIGTAPFPNSNNSQKTTFRADITSLGLVSSGLNTLTIDNVDFTNVNDGAGVLVIIDDNSGSSSDLQIRDGQDFAFIGITDPPEGQVTVPQTFTFTPASVQRTANLILFVGSVEAPRENSLEHTVDGPTIAPTTTTLSDPFVDNDGSEWDTFKSNVNIPAGAETLTVQLFSRDDNPGEEPDFPASLSWVVATLTLNEPPLVCSGIIGDFIWSDLNRNGIQDAGEPGIEGVTKILRDEQGNEISRTTSGPDGFYQFNELCAGTYFIDLDTSSVPTGFQVTLIEQGGNPEFDSNDLTKPVVLATDTSEDLTIDCGFVPPAGGGQGCTPGYWRQTQHFDSWVNFAPNDLFSNVFGRVITVRTSPGGGRPLRVVGPTLLEAVWTAGDGAGVGALARHAVAALLNAANPDVNYAFSQSEIITKVQDAIDTGMFEATKNELAAENERGCPID